MLYIFFIAVGNIFSTMDNKHYCTGHRLQSMRNRNIRKSGWTLIEMLSFCLHIAEIMSSFLPSDLSGVESAN